MLNFSHQIFYTLLFFICFTCLTFAITLNFSFYSDRKRRTIEHRTYINSLACLSFFNGLVLYTCNTNNEYYTETMNYILLVGIIPLGIGIYLLFRYKDYKMIVDIIGIIAFGLVLTPINKFAFKIIYVIDVAYFFVRALYSLHKELHLLQSSKNLFSIKSAMDKLTIGLYIEGRYAVYQNPAFMYAMDILKIKKFNSIEVIWKQLMIKAKKDNDDKYLILQSPTNSYLYQFIVGKEFKQIIITDVTKETQLIESLKQKQIELNDQNQKMVSLIDKTKDAAMKNEVERAKIRIHDVLGQRLSIMHQVLATIDYRDYDISLIHNLLDSIDYEIKKDSDVSIKELKDGLIESFKMIDFDIEITGNIENYGDKASPLLKVIRECATNAIRHAKATKLFVNLDGNCIIIYDNGIHKQKEIKEGTGLKGIRQRLSSIDGKLESAVSSDDSFIITISLREEK